MTRQNNPITTLQDGQVGIIIFGIHLDDTSHWFNITGSDSDAAHQMFNLHRNRITDLDDSDANWVVYFDDGESAVEYIQLNVCNSTDRDRILSIMSTSRPVQAAETVETPAEPVEAYVVDMPTRPSFSSFLWDMRQTAKTAAAASPLTFTIRYVEDNIDAITDEWSALVQGDMKQAEQMIADGHEYSGYIQQQLDTLQAMLPECSFDASAPESFKRN